MAKYLIDVVETYRVDQEFETESLIDTAKQAPNFELIKHACEKKEVKQKGEVVDEYFVVKLVKRFNNPKEPTDIIHIDYEVQG